MTEVTEAVFQKRVLARLKKLPNSLFFTKEAMSIRGISDILGVCNGRFIAIELKRNAKEANKKTGRIALQRYFIDQVNEKRGYAAIIHPDNLEEFIQDLSRISTGEELGDLSHFKSIKS